MKNANQMMVTVLSLVLLTCMSCKKSTTDQTPVNNTASNISKIEHSTDYSEISYNTDGTVKSISTKLSSGNLTGTLNFIYDGNKLKEAAYGSIKLKYTYTAGFVTKVETLNGAGSMTHKNEFSYVNNKLAEVTEYWPNGSGGLLSYGKEKFTYNNTGNITKTEYFDYLNNAWVKTGEISMVEYDNKINTTSGLEDFGFLPGINLSSNNPLKEEHKNELGTIVLTIQHVYVYDGNGRPIQRTSTTKIPGAADNIEVTKFYY